MAKQIGWSQESNLLYQISALITKLTQVTAANSGGGGSMAIGGAITSATAGSVLFAGASGVLQQDNANFFWDDTNNRLGIGTASPTFALDTRSDAVVNGWVIGKGSNTSLFNLRITEQTNTSFGSITTAANNIFIGRNTGLSLTTGSGNVGIGQGSGQVISTGSNNLCIGGLTAIRISSGSGNIVVGNGSLSQVTTQNNNVVIGANSGNFTYPAYNNALPASSIYIGANLFPGSTTSTNEIVISSYGDLSGLGSNTTMIGNSFTVTAAIRGRVLLGTTTDSGLYQLDVNGTARVVGNADFVSARVSYKNTAVGAGSGTGIEFATDLSIPRADFIVGGVYVGGFQSNANDFGIGNSRDGGALTFSTRNTTSSIKLKMFNDGNTILQDGGTFGYIQSSQLTINSTTRGFLPPRMTNAQRTAISSPAVGLMVYCTDAVEGLYIYKSTGWTFVI